MQAREPRFGASTGAQTPTQGAADGDRRGGLVRGLSSFAAHEAVLSPVQLKPDPNGSKPKRPKPKKGPDKPEGDSVDARLDELAAGLAASNTRIEGLEKKVGEQQQTIEEQKQALDANAMRDADQDRKNEQQDRQIEAQALINSALAMMDMISLHRALAIDKLKLEIETAPPPLSETLKAVIRTTLSTFFGFASGLIGKAFANFSEVEKPLVAGVSSGLSSLASAGMDEGLAVALKDPDDPGVFFLAIHQAARLQSLAFLPHVQAIARVVPNVDDPVKVASALHDAVSQIASGAFQVQYDATFGAYYQTVMVSDVAKKQSSTPGGIAADPTSRGPFPVAGLLVIEANGDDRIPDIFDADFNGEKTAGHMEYLRNTPLGRLRVPTRLEISSALGSATFFRDASGSVTVSDDASREWLVESLARQRELDPNVLRAPSRMKEESHALFERLSGVTLSTWLN